MLDLQALGRELRERRRMLRIPSAELARRIGVSQTYVWLIESATPRKNGLPSRPSEEVLRQWTRALGMGPVDTERMLSLAGYFGTPSEVEAPRPMSRLARAVPERAFAPLDLDQRAAYSAAPPPAAAPMAMPSPPADESASDEPESELGERLQQLLRTADARGRTEEVAGLVRSHLRWLQHLIEHEGGE